MDMANADKSREFSASHLRVATYNVHGCVGMDRQRSESRIAEVIASMKVDVVGLQELDLGRSRSAHADQAALIAAQLGWKHYFYPAMQTGDEQYGNAIVSRFPMELRCAAEMPGMAPWYCREQRVAIWMEAATDVGPVHIINTHFGLGGSERRLQAQLLVGPAWIGSIPPNQPAILLGDFNSLPYSPAYRLIATHLRDARSLARRWTAPNAFGVRPRRAFRTFPTRLPSLAVDHIFVNNVLDVAALAVHRTPLARLASDHFPLRCELRLVGWENSSSIGEGAVASAPCPHC
jgi:endonuclease/exonuclease/phosphatase family metal-dependent hydrolase